MLRRINFLSCLFGLTVLLVMPVLRPAQAMGEILRVWPSRQKVAALGSLLILHSGNLKKHNDNYLQFLITGMEKGQLRYMVRWDGAWLIEGADGSRREHSLVLREELERDSRFVIGAHENATALLFRPNPPNVLDDKESAVESGHVFFALREIRLARESRVSAQEGNAESVGRGQGQEEQTQQAQARPPEQAREEMEQRANKSTRRQEWFSRQSKKLNGVFETAGAEEPLVNAVADAPRADDGDSVLLGGSGNDILATDNSAKGGRAKLCADVCGLCRSSNPIHQKTCHRQHQIAADCGCVPK